MCLPYLPPSNLGPQGFGRWNSVKGLWEAIPPGLVWDDMSWPRDIEDLGHGAICHCPRCDMRDNRPDENNECSAHTVIKGCSSQGRWCWNCRTMYWFSTTTRERLHPYPGTIRPLRDPLTGRELKLADVMSVAEVRVLML